ncbi:hypothetical protein BAE44_0009224 [Dichanthelium oligosanthes]|uniref:Uncharacterized protein n=1 Tax=Dichanthelium oligosanthes TaxID=888268 RepID=A0A1E5VXD0_9POAL|nr:hypothetical protein BAE44_0009224 [Dichanthelium oligosanthes]
MCAHELTHISLDWDLDQLVVSLDPLPQFVISLVDRDLTELVVN